MQDTYLLGGISAKIYFLSRPIAKMIYSFDKIYYFSKNNKGHILLTDLILQLSQVFNNPLLKQI